MELEIEILWHTDETIKKDRMDIDADVEEYDRRTHTFYHIDAICPFYVNKEPILCQIFASGNKFLSAYDYETTRGFINAAKNKTSNVSADITKEQENLYSHAVHRNLEWQALTEWLKRQPRSEPGLHGSYFFTFRGLWCCGHIVYTVDNKIGIRVRACIITESLTGIPGESLIISSEQILKREI